MAPRVLRQDNLVVVEHNADAVFRLLPSSWVGGRLRHVPRGGAEKRTLSAVSELYPSGFGLYWGLLLAFALCVTGHSDCLFPPIIIIGCALELSMRSPKELASNSRGIKAQFAKIPDDADDPARLPWCEVMEGLLVRASPRVCFCR